MEPTLLLILALGVIGAKGQDAGTPGALQCYQCTVKAVKDSNCSQADCEGLCGLAKLDNGFVMQTCVAVAAADDIIANCKPAPPAVAETAKRACDPPSEVSKVCCSTDFCNGLPVMCAGPRQAAASALLLAVCAAVSVLVLVLE